MKYLKTYEGVFSFLKKNKPPEEIEDWENWGNDPFGEDIVQTDYREEEILKARNKIDGVLANSQIDDKLKKQYYEMMSIWRNELKDLESKNPFDPTDESEEKRKIYLQELIKYGRRKVLGKNY